MDWQPIETAPRDGTPILVWDEQPWDGFNAFVARWFEVPAKKSGLWIAAGGYSPFPTLWMPLPPPPIQ